MCRHGGHGIRIRRKGWVSTPLGAVMNMEQVTQDVTTEGEKLERYTDSYFIDSWMGLGRLPMWSLSWPIMLSARLSAI
jgi:hypothetical protein